MIPHSHPTCKSYPAVWATTPKSPEEKYPQSVLCKLLVNIYWPTSGLMHISREQGNQPKSKFALAHNLWNVLLLISAES
jgi:hypothetical protein